MNDSANTLNSTPAESWFVATNAGAVEYDLDALKSEIEHGRVQLSTLVWRHGMPAWVELEQVPLLRMLVPGQPSPMPRTTSAEPAIAASSVSAALLDDFSGDKTTALASVDEFKTPSPAPARKQSRVTSEQDPSALPAAHSDHWQASTESVKLSAVEPTHAIDAFAEELAEPITIRPAPIKSTATPSAPDSTSIFKGLFDNPTLSSGGVDITDVVDASDISDISDVVDASDISDDEQGLSITESAPPIATKSITAAAEFAGTKSNESVAADRLESNRLSALHAPGALPPQQTALHPQDSHRRPAAEPAPQKTKSLPAESIRPILVRPVTPRVSIEGISTRLVETRPVLQVPKREPISEGLARSTPMRAFSERPASTGAVLPSPKPLYTPLIQPPTPVPTMRPLSPARTPPARTRPSILPPLSPLPVTEPHQAVVTETLPAALGPTSTPKTRLERLASVKPNSSVSINAVVAVTQSVPVPSVHANTGAQAAQRSAETARTSSPTMVGMPPRVEPMRAASESTMVGMPPRIEPTRAAPESARASEPTIIGMPSRGQSIRGPAESAMVGILPPAHPMSVSCSESTFIGMPPRQQPAYGPAKSDQDDLLPTNDDVLADSIYPSISSIQPALRGPRNVRRTLIMMSAVGVTAAAAVVFAFVQSDHEQVAVSVPSAHVRIRNNAASGSDNKSTEAVELPAAKHMDTSSQETAPAVEKTTPAPAQDSKSRRPEVRATTPAVTRPVVEVNTPAANISVRSRPNQLTRNAEVTPIAKSAPQGGNQPAPNKATPTADWEQGTVEKRAWMSPGF